MGLGVYQNPELVSKGESAVGVGVTYLVVTNKFGYFMPTPEPYFRYGLSENQEITVRIPLIASILGNEGFFLLSGGYRMAVKNFIFSGDLLFYGGSQSGAFLVEPGVFYRYNQYVAGIQVAGGAVESRIRLPAFIRFYAAKSFNWKNEKILPGVQLSYAPGNGISLILELGLQHSGIFKR